MHIDQFKQPDGWYIDANGTSHENATDFLISILGFCGCGMPEEALAYTRDVLQHIANLKTLVWTDKLCYEKWKEAGKVLFPSEGAEYFVYNVLDTKDLIEHGSSVPGWLVLPPI